MSLVTSALSRVSLGGVGGHHILNWTIRRAATKYGRLFRRNLPFSRSPHVVEIELTNDCNQRCVHCPRNQMTRPVGYMAFPTFAKVVDEMARYPYRVLRMVGLGEAAMHPDFARMLDYAKSRKVDVDITSNGTIFDVLSFEEIAASSIVMLGISVDGVDERSYAKIRLGGDYAKLRAHMAGFSAFRKATGRGPMVVARSVIMPRAQTGVENYVAAFKAEWADLCDRIKFNTMMPPEARTVYDTGRVCDDIFFNAHVRWDGRVPLCNYQTHYTAPEWLGNVNDEPLVTLWKSSRAQEVRRAHLSGDLAKAEFCKRCFFQQCQSRTKANQARFNASRKAHFTFLEKAAWRLLQ